MQAIGENYPRVCRGRQDLARFLYVPDHAVDSGSNLVKILSPKPVDKFVDNLKKNIMPYCFPTINNSLPKK